MNPSDTQSFIEILDERTPEVMRSLLHGLDHLAILDYGAETFSPYNVIGHLIIGEREDWIPRLQIIREHGETRPFDEFNHRATIDPGEGPPLSGLLDEFARLRAANMQTLREMNLDEESMGFSGTHPGLGTVTASELLHAWTVHDLHHIAQVCKGLARQFGPGTGPFAHYIGILTR